jgi:hypothetical protein
MSVSAMPNARQLRIATDNQTGQIYLCRTSHKDRGRILEKHNITDEVLIAAVQSLCLGHPREGSSFITIRIPSGNYRIYIREVSDIEADKFAEMHRADEALYGK